MKFTLEKASDYKFREEITIDTLADLEELAEEYNYSLVINFENEYIIIYDDYLE